ncbi:MAG: hypothetical protein RhofKO_31830 [Rhodothermales bacterium]
MKIVQHLSEASIDALRAVIGRPVFQLLSRNLMLDRYGFGISSGNFSIDLLESQYCVVEGGWADTLRAGIDYHFLSASLADWPKHVGRLKDLERESYYQAYPSHIILPGGTFPVTSITVHTHAAEEGSEAVEYDHALVFTRSDGLRFALAAFSAWLTFTHDSETIDGVISTYPEQLCLD